MDVVTVERICDEIADRGYSGEQAKLLRRLASQLDGDPVEVVTAMIQAFPKIFAVKPAKAGPPRRR